MRNVFRSLALITFAGLFVPLPAFGVVYPLHVQAYCAFQSYCGFGNFEAYEAQVLSAVQQLNREWAIAGISFQPTVFEPIDDGYYSDLPGCKKGTAFKAKRAEWLVNVGAQKPDVISLMITAGSNRCCADPPDGPYLGSNITENYSLFGIFCNVEGDAKDRGTVWSHEMGHYFCLRHTMTFQDQIDVLPGAPNYDGDTAFDVFDTPPDPGTREGSDVDDDDNLLPLHEYCDYTLNAGGADPGSSNPATCTPQCIQHPAGSNPVSLAANPMTTAVMSYYGSECRGPTVVGGITRPGLTPDSLAQIQVCRNQVPARQGLMELCTDPGDGDPDMDGICASEDNCLLVANTPQQNSDGDGFGDACDPCPLLVGQGVDTDGDGICEADSDGDGCNDLEDQHPNDGEVLVATESNAGCGSNKKIYQSEGIDADDDGLPSCLDPDDDDDGICDDATSEPAGTPGAVKGCSTGPDPCPYNEGGCARIGVPDDCQELFLICQRGGCVEYFLKLTQLINPDPTREIVFDHFEIANGKLYVVPLANRTLSETAMALTGGFQVEGFEAGVSTGPGGGGAADHDDPVQLEIWRRDPLERVAVVAAFERGDVGMRDITRGAYIEFALVNDGAGGARITVAATWAVAEGPGARLPDADGDGVPDGFDVCIEAHDPDQRDGDRDGFGDACDPDPNNDLVVDSFDVNYVRTCRGVDLSARASISEPADNEGEFDMGGIDAPLASSDALAAAVDCKAADVDGDGDVDNDDSTFVDRSLGSRPGPSAKASIDIDGDRIPDDTDVCPLVADREQIDEAGLGEGSGPDGRGRECQCGDVDGSESITGSDVEKLRGWLTRSLEKLDRPELCNVRGPATPRGGDPTTTCDVVDLVVLRRALEQLDPALEGLCGERPRGPLAIR